MSIRLVNLSTILILWWYVALVVAVSKASISEGITPSASPSNVVDVLSSDVQFSYFLRHLQRSGMIPILNELSNYTLIAPINSAYARKGRQEAQSENVDGKEVNEHLRYVIKQPVHLNKSIKEPIVYETYYKTDSKYYPLIISQDSGSDQLVIDGKAAIVEPNLYASNQNSYVQGTDELLDEKDSLCDILMSRNAEHDQIQGHNISFIKSLFQSTFGDINSKVSRNTLPIDIPSSCGEFMQKSRTFFIPTDSLVEESISDLQRKYYLSISSSIEDMDLTERAVYEITRDIVELLEYLMIGEYVGGSNGSYKSIKAVNGKLSYNISLESSGRLVLNNNLTASVLPIAYSDQVLHIFGVWGNQKTGDDGFFSKLNIPLTPLVPRKVLYALHYSKFLEELYFRSLGNLIDSNKVNFTLFLNPSDSDRNLDNDRIRKSPYRTHRRFNSLEQVHYHFYDEVFNTTVIEESGTNFNVSFLTSLLCRGREIGSCFKNKVFSSLDAATGTYKHVLDGDITIASPPYFAVDDSTIYILDDDLEAPESLKTTLINLITSNGVNISPRVRFNLKTCLKTMHYFDYFKLFALENNNKGYTIFLPCGSGGSDFTSIAKDDKDAWSSLGLYMNYLVSRPDVFKSVIQNLILEGLIYSDFASNPGDVFNTTTLDSESLNITAASVGELESMWKVNHANLSVPLGSELFFDKGLIHLTDMVLIPDSLEIPLLDLIKTTYDDSYADYNMLELLEKLPVVRDMLGLDGGSSEYSLLIPETSSLKDFNISANFYRLHDFLQFHLIPNSELTNLLTCMNEGYSENSTDSTVSLVHTNITDGVLRCVYRPKKNKYFLQHHRGDSVEALGYSRDHEVEVIAHGCSKFHKESQGPCVFLIEKPLSLEWLNKPNDNLLHVHLRIISIGVGIILGLFLMGSAIFGFLIYAEKFGHNQALAIPISSSTRPSHNNEQNISNMHTNGDASTINDGNYGAESNSPFSETSSLLRGGANSNPRYTENSSRVTAPVLIRQASTKPYERNHGLPNMV
ncbi:Piso0_001297 [Millerozyma farinosa CBS 7064]|uniref:Piso0_001297 protein n=1 Tax=Pichia sorbitophila (strain ATCC MYA-4447 / BCRC 22081 / CBS 7064 / NBRC 10061 / NRRL Y-12695) TaxID=559304 RepID=G8YMS7_PICSO|nr:Piso0_001297 [Millerozyma farinosa CBS 7064]